MVSPIKRLSPIILPFAKVWGEKPREEDEIHLFF